MADANLHPKCPAGKNKTDGAPGTPRIEAKKRGEFLPRALNSSKPGD
jgi:ribosomal protein S30